MLLFLRKTAPGGITGFLQSLYIWICLGVSFVYINSVGYHHQAARVGAMFFGITAIAWAFITARTLGFVGKKKHAGTDIAGERYYGSQGFSLSSAA